MDNQIVGCLEVNYMIREIEEWTTINKIFAVDSVVSNLMTDFDDSS
jgi:hypothetical protein